jgi:succinate dehydrogenase/fumarate reductase flavoprotein subunit
MTEAFVFGHRAGTSAAAYACSGQAAPLRPSNPRTRDLEGALAEHSSRGRKTPARLASELQDLMWRDAGPFRNAARLESALQRIRSMRQELSDARVSGERSYNLDRVDWFELRAMLWAAQAVVLAALSRAESRGAHQREDFPEMNDALSQNQVIELRGNELAISWREPERLGKAP